MLKGVPESAQKAINDLQVKLRVQEMSTAGLHTSTGVGIHS